MAAIAAQDAVLGGIILLLEQIERRRIEVECPQDVARRDATGDQPVGQEEPPGRVPGVVEPGQAGEGQMDGGQTGLAPVPVARGPAERAEHRRSDRPLIGDREQGQQAGLGTLQPQPALADQITVQPGKHRPGAQHQPVPPQRQAGLDGAKPAALLPLPLQPFRQHRPSE